MGMVHSVASRPAEIGNEQHAVQQKANPRFHSAIGVECIVAAFMGNHPAPHRHGTCDDGVHDPERTGAPRQRDLCANAVGHERQTQ